MRRALGALAALALLAAPLGLRAEDARPPALRDTGFDQRLGARLPLDAPFRDEAGRAVRLGDYFGERPVVLVPAYYRCPMLCTVVLQGVVSALRALPFHVGRELTVVAFSFDPEETAARAGARKQAALAEYRRPEAAAGWHFLTGEEESIRRLTEAIGFRYAFDAGSGQFAHASGIVVATPGGVVSHYFYGVEYAPRDLRLALVEASAGRIGSAVDQLLLLCFAYDASLGRYSAAALASVRVGGLVTLLALAGGIAFMLRREARRRAGA